MKEKNYTIKNGTCYHGKTPSKLINLLERLRKSNDVVRVFYGHTDTGRSWMEENDVKGTIGRSTGNVKIPLLIEEGECGGSGLMDDRIIAIRDSNGKFIYKVKNAFCPKMEIIYGEDKTYPIELLSEDKSGDMSLHARFKNTHEAYQFMANQSIPS